MAGVLQAEHEKDESKSSGGGVGEEWGTLAGWGPRGPGRGPRGPRGPGPPLQLPVS